jgi:copper oxidase (laccase) domain-containing protein
MNPPNATDIHAIIGPGISLECFEVGDEVYEIFQRERFPMQRIAKRFPGDGGEAWHIDLWEANRWLMEQQGVTDIFVQGICTRSSMDFYSARRETINTGRNYNGIMILR